MSKSIGATKQDLVEMENRLAKTMHEMMQEMLGAMQYQFEIRDKKINKMDHIETTVNRIENKLDATNEKS